MNRQIIFLISLILLAFSAFSQNQGYETNIKAVMYFDNLIHQAPNAEIYYQKGMGYFYIGDYTSAIKDFDEAVQLGYNKPEVFYFRALAKENDGMYKEALSDYDKAIQLSGAKANYFMYMHRGYSHYNLSMYPQAIEDFSKAIALNPNDDETKYLLERAIARRDGKSTINPDDEIQKYIATHKFSSMAEGAAYYDKLVHMGLTHIRFEDACTSLRTKVITDVYGDAPTAEQLEELRDILQREKWLLPEGMEKYFHYVSENPNAFRGEVKRPTYTYYYEVVKDTKGNRYDLVVKKLDEDEMISIVYTSYIFVTEGAGKDDIVVHLHYATGDGMEWRVSPKDYLEVVYSKNNSTVIEKAIGKMETCLLPNVPKTKLLERDASKEFSNKEAIRKAVEIMLVAYEKVVPDA
ncbi:MAG: hypothetical protein OHK0057_19930 [Thermoflexibacter sp.]